MKQQIFVSRSGALRYVVGEQQTHSLRLIEVPVRPAFLASLSARREVLFDCDMPWATPSVQHADYCVFDAVPMLVHNMRTTMPLSGAFTGPWRLTHDMSHWHAMHCYSLSARALCSMRREGSKDKALQRIAELNQKELDWFRNPYVRRHVAAA